jgi:hypothetical protein
VLDQRDIGGQAAAPGQFLDAASRKGVTFLPVTPCASASLQRLFGDAVDLFLWHANRHRIADHDAAFQAELPLGAG